MGNLNNTKSDRRWKRFGKPKVETDSIIIPEIDSVIIPEIDSVIIPEIDVLEYNEEYKYDIDKKNILLIGRKNNKIGSGIFYSNNMLNEILTNVGFNVIFLDSLDFETYLNKKYDIDLVFLYDDSVFSCNNIEKIISISKLYYNKPILCNSMYNNTFDRDNTISNNIEYFKKNGLDNINLMVFSKISEDLLNQKYNTNKFFFLPKTIRCLDSKIKNFNQRKDIFLGDFNKFVDKELNGGIDISEFVFNFKKRFPNIELHAFTHHKLTYRPDIKDFDYIKNNINLTTKKNNLCEYISNYRLYISLIKHETFSMIPLEVQNCGCPIFYRSMKHSLDSYLSNSGYMWDNFSDLLNSIDLMYFNEKLWTQMSYISVNNFKNNNYKNIEYLFLLQIEKLINKTE